MTNDGVGVMGWNSVTHYNKVIVTYFFTFIEHQRKKLCPEHIFNAN